MPIVRLDSDFGGLNRLERNMRAPLVGILLTKFQKASINNRHSAHWSDLGSDGLLDMLPLTSQYIDYKVTTHEFGAS